MYSVRRTAGHPPYRSAVAPASGVDDADAAFRDVTRLDNAHGTRSTDAFAIVIQRRCSGMSGPCWAAPRRKVCACGRCFSHPDTTAYKYRQVVAMLSSAACRGLAGVRGRAIR